jgi:hypothetical protein
MIGPREWALTLISAALLLGTLAYGVLRVYA